MEKRVDMINSAELKKANEVASLLMAADEEVKKGQAVQVYIYIYIYIGQLLHK
jgi:hypothetical protein